MGELSTKYSIDLSIKKSSFVTTYSGYFRTNGKLLIENPLQLLYNPKSVDG